MNPKRLTGFVYPVKKNGVPVRGRWQLWVNLPPEPAFDRDGQPVLDSRGRQKQRYPKTTKVVEAPGKKAAERLLETWIAELESHRTIDPHLPIHGLRDSFGTWVYETYGVKQAQEWLGHSDPATTLRHYVRLTTAARAKAVAGLDEVTRAALEQAEVKVLEDALPLEDNVVALAGRRRSPCSASPRASPVKPAS